MSRNGPTHLWEFTVPSWTDGRDDTLEGMSVASDGRLCHQPFLYPRYCLTRGSCLFSFMVFLFIYLFVCLFIFLFIYLLIYLVVVGGRVSHYSPVLSLNSLCSHVGLQFVAVFLS